LAESVSERLENMEASVRFRWLGVAGIELKAHDEILVIDPFFTRPPMRRMWFGRVSPNHELIVERIPRCDYVLVTHAHWDHVMDVPDIARNTGAVALGSANTCKLLRACGVAGEQIRETVVGDQIKLGRFQVEFIAAEHMRSPGFSPGPLSANLKPPLRLGDYRMDNCFSLLIEVDGLRLLDWSSIRADQAPCADVLFLRLYAKRAHYEALLRAVQPRLAVPVHWDNLFRPLSKPVRPYFKPPSRSFPPLQRMDPRQFRETIRVTNGELNVLIPDVFRAYELRSILDRGQAEDPISSQQMAMGVTGDAVTPMSRRGKTINRNW
jgi:L-ascorbate metabolism protein UlaG (beta-lactamase superfamily)